MKKTLFPLISALGALAGVPGMPPLRFMDPGDPRQRRPRGYSPGRHNGPLGPRTKEQARALRTARREANRCVAAGRRGL